MHKKLPGVAWRFIVKVKRSPYDSCFPIIKYKKKGEKMRVATDIGGTFTDLVYVDHDGEVKVDKAHTTPPNFEQGVMNVLEKETINPKEIETFIHGTTVIINALTEKTGAKTGLITTKGFRVQRDDFGCSPRLFLITTRNLEDLLGNFRTF